jgi:hypothetical protein
MRIHYRFSSRKEIISSLTNIKTLLAIDDDVDVNMSQTKKMICVWKNHIYCLHQISFHVDDDRDRIENFQLIIKCFQLIQHSKITSDCFLRHETKIYIQVNM